jgi:hypothetical protein
MNGSCGVTIPPKQSLGHAFTTFSSMFLLLLLLFFQLHCLYIITAIPVVALLPS